jgi:uncharacterized protein YigA (DUF484 family)
MAVLETLEDIFAHIAIPQNLAKKVALVKNQVATLEQKIINLDGKVIKLAAELKDDKLVAERKEALAELLRPEQGHAKPRPRVIMKRDRGY